AAGEQVLVPLSELQWDAERKAFLTPRTPAELREQGSAGDGDIGDGVLASAIVDAVLHTEDGQRVPAQALILDVERGAPAYLLVAADAAHAGNGNGDGDGDGDAPKRPEGDN